MSYNPERGSAGARSKLGTAVIAPNAQNTIGPVNGPAAVQVTLTAEGKKQLDDVTACLSTGLAISDISGATAQRLGIKPRTPTADEEREIERTLKSIPDNVRKAFESPARRRVARATVQVKGTTMEVEQLFFVLEDDFPRSMQLGMDFFGRTQAVLYMLFNGMGYISIDAAGAIEQQGGERTGREFLRLGVTGEEVELGAIVDPPHTYVGRGRVHHATHEGTLKKGLGNVCANPSCRAMSTPEHQFLVCSVCSAAKKLIYYCDADCQKADWKEHKKLPAHVADRQRKKAEKEFASLNLDDELEQPD